MLPILGVVKRYPRIRWILGHLGGTISYLAERLDRGWRAFAACRAHIDEPPTTYLSDYPHKIGSIKLMLEAIRALPISADDKAGILGGNAAKLLGV